MKIPVDFAINIIKLNIKGWLNIFPKLFIENNIFIDIDNPWKKNY
jgi:hypothetical protein